MKNYIEAWLMARNDGMNPPNLLAFGFAFSQPEALQFIQDNGWNAGPTQYFFLLNKWNLLPLINSYPGWTVFADATLDPNVLGQYTRNKDEAKNWGGDSALWLYDTSDKFSVQAHQSATKTRGTALQTANFSGAGGLVQFVANLPAYAEILRKEGRVRDAGIVLFVYRQVIDGQISITDGLAILRENRL